MVANNLTPIYGILAEKGIDKSFIHKYLLPDWWEEDVLNTKSGYLQTLGILSNVLGINISFFLEPENYKAENALKVKFKTNKNSNIESSEFWIQLFSKKLSEIVNCTFDKEYQPISNNPSEIRTKIIEKYAIINLSSMLQYLWAIGVPVIYLPNLPKDIKGMDGMVIMGDNRPIIIISNRRRHDAWLLFIIAHELGHIGLSHLSNSETVLYDSDISVNSELDSDEKEANEFALKLLLGSSTQIDLPKVSSPFVLVNKLRNLGKQLNIDPGIIALNYAYNNKSFPLASMALNNLEPKPNAPLKITEAMQMNMRLDNISEENYDYFTKLTSLSEPEV